VDLDAHDTPELLHPQGLVDERGKARGQQEKGADLC